MKIKRIEDENFNHYRRPSMVVAFPSCTFKCNRACGEQVCQNGTLAASPDIEITPEEIVHRYLHNHISKAIVCAGLEPLDSPDDLLALVRAVRMRTDAEIIIYTGYTKEEVQGMNGILDALSMYSNMIIKYGRYIPGCETHIDEILGVPLYGDHQYAEVISK